MNKAELVEFVAEKTGAYKKDAKYAVEAVLEGIAKGLLDDGKVTLVDFGNFVVKERAPRVARNPQTGQTVRIPSRHVPVFKPSQSLKDMID